MRPERAELERRVDELASEHVGLAFAEAVRAYSQEIDAGARKELGEVLLERAGGPELAVRERWEERFWFRRVFRRMSGQRR